MAVLDYFNVSPGDKKRAELELQNRLRLGQSLSDIDKKRALDIRDSNQLSADFERHKQERELQGALSSLYPSSDPSLTGDENQTLSMIHAADKMNEIKAAQPLASSATNMNVAEQAAGARQFNPEVGASSALAGIAGNQAGIAGNVLSKAISGARQKTAPAAAAQADTTNIANLINDYDMATSAVPASRRDREYSENVNKRNEAESANASLKAREQNTISSALAGAREGEGMQAYWNNVNQAKAAQAANLKNDEQMKAYQFLIDNPKYGALIKNPGINSALGMEEMMKILGGDGNTSANGGLNAPVGGRRKAGININQ